MQVSKSKRFVLFAIACSILGYTHAQDAPAPADIAKALVADLPSYWAIKNVQISATVNDGDAIDPRFRQRFIATVVPTEKLYSELPKSKVEPYVVLIETRSPKQPHNLYGITSSVLKLGAWQMEFQFENGTRGLGLPQSMYSRPVIIPDTAQANKAIETLISAQELSKTLAEQTIRAEANAEAIRKAAGMDQEVLLAENRKRLDTLVLKYEQERTAIKTSHEQESAAIITSHKQRLEAIKEAQEQELAAIEATVETRTQIGETKAEITALKELSAVQEELSAVQEELARKRKIAEEKQQALLTGQIEEESKRRATLLEALRSEDEGERLTAFDLLFDSQDEKLSVLALDEAFASGDKNLRVHAIEVAMKSGVEAFRARALASWIAQKPEIIMTMYNTDGQRYRGVQYFDVLAVDENLKITGKLKLDEMKWFQEYNYSVSNNVDGTGLVHQDRISLQGPFIDNRDHSTLYCTGELYPNTEGLLAGQFNCPFYGSDSTNFLAVVDIWSMREETETE